MVEILLWGYSHLCFALTSLFFFFFFNIAQLCFKWADVCSSPLKGTTEKNVASLFSLDDSHSKKKSKSSLNQ